MGLNKSKKKTSILRRIVYLSLSLLLIFSSLSIVLILNAENIGNWYDKQEERVKGADWFELNYSLRKSDDALLKLCYGLLMTDDYPRIYKYYGQVINNRQINLDNDLRALYITDYIISSYYVEGIDKYKELYNKYVYELSDSSVVYFPLDVVLFGPMKVSDMPWVIEFTDQLLQLNSEPINRVGIYFYQAWAYERIGNVERAKEINAIAEKIKNDILNRK